MTTSTTIVSRHPAPGRLWALLARERLWLTRALAIEADWLYHDGPELRVRYRAASALQQSPQATNHPPYPDEARVGWPALGRTDCARARASFRRLLAATHPQLRPAGNRQGQPGYWPSVRDAYRAGSLDTLLALEERIRAGCLIEPWPQEARSIKTECDRLQRARSAVDTRLLALSEQFPFTLRERLAGDRAIDVRCMLTR